MFIRHKTELPYRGSDEERNTLYQYLESITTDKEYGQIASDILGEQAENKEKPNRQIEFQTEELGQASSVISIELPQGWKIQKREQTQRAENKPLALASLNPSYPVYDIYDKIMCWLARLDTVPMNHMKVIEIPCRLFTLHFG